jgi:hypothetical protein
VRSHGRSLAVSIGLPAYTEATLLKVVLERLQFERLMWKPLPSFPRHYSQLFEQAERETSARIIEMLEAIKLAVPATASQAPSQGNELEESGALASR